MRTITPASVLPTITDTVTIDGVSQPGSSPNTNSLALGINAVPLIELSGLNSRLTVNANGTTIRGLVINQSSDLITVAADNVTIRGNFLGTNATGTVGLPLAGGGFGVRHNGGNNLTIGGPANADRNLLSGNEQGGLIIGFFPVSTGT